MSDKSCATCTYCETNNPIDNELFCTNLDSTMFLEGVRPRWCCVKYERINVNRAIVNKAVKTYGKEKELNVACEEMSELTKEICKALRHNLNLNEKDRVHMLEEIADVYVILENIKEVFNFTDGEIGKEISKKQHRLVCRMNLERKKFQSTQPLIFI